MSGNKILQKIWYVYLFCVLLFAGYTAVSFCRPHMSDGFNSRDYLIFSDGWQFQLGSRIYQNVTLPLNVEVPSDAGDVVLIRSMPQYINDDWYLSVSAALNTATVYLDDTKIAEYKGAEGLFATSIPTNERLFVKMKSEYGGRRLKIVYNTRLKQYKGNIPPVYLGDRADIIYGLIAKKWPVIFAGIFMAFVGLAVLIITIFLKKWVSHKSEYVYMGIYLFFVGVWFCLQTGMAQLIFTDITYARAMEFFSIMMSSVPYTKHIDSVTEHRYILPARIICVASVLSIFVSFMLVYGFHYDFMDIFWITLIVLAATIIFVITVFTVTLFTDRQLYERIKWLAVANYIFCAGSLVEIADTFIDPINQNGRFLAIASIIYSICALKWGVTQIRNDEARKERIVRQAMAKSTFLANMSHEIRTPVNAIIGINDIISKETSEETVRTYSSNIRYSAKALLGLINKILDSSKLESGRMRLVNAEYSFFTLVDDLVKYTEDFAGGKVTLIVRNNTGIPSMLYGDEPKIVLMISHVLENAFKFTQEGAVILGFDYREEDGGGITLINVICDTGNGMSPKELDAIFSQGGKATDEENGTGLGLSISRQLAELMGGYVRVDSYVGIGSVFVTEIRQNVSVASPAGKYSRKDIQEIKDETADFHDISILAADDEPMNLKILGSVLEDMGLSADTAHDGFEALSKAAEKKYDLILMDHMMPGMSGEETFNAIRKDANGMNGTTPVLMLTAEDSQDFIDRVQQCGFAGYILKPVTKKAVEKALLRIKIGGEENE